MTVYLRVQWRATGHESTIPAVRFDHRRHVHVRKPATDRHGKPLPPKFRTNLAGAPAPRPTNPVPVAAVAPDSGHRADHERES